MGEHTKGEPIVFVVDDDPQVREGVKVLLESMNLRCEAFNSTREFLEYKPHDGPSCLILDVRLPGHSGLDFQQELARAQINTPIIFISGYADVPMTVRAMKGGAFGFLTKPIHEQDLLDAVHSALDYDKVHRKQGQQLVELRKRFEALSPRERQVMTLVAAGLMNKQAAVEIGLSEVTVKFHRHNLMRKLGVKSIVELSRAAEMLGIVPKGDGIN